MKKAILMSSVLFATSMASAATMSCYVGVLKVAEIITETTEEKSYQLVNVSLDKEGSGNLEVTVNGETVSVDLYKKQFADVYSMTLVLKGAQNFLALGQDYLVNEGPTRSGATDFGYLKNEGGSLYLTQKMVAALKANNMWGQYPFTSNTMAAQNGFSVVEAVETLVAKKALEPSDVVAMATAYSCKLNK